MAEHPELWTDRASPDRPLFDHKHSFGLANEAERVRLGIDRPSPRSVASRPRSAGHGGAVSRVLLRSRGHNEGRLSNIWHRVKCRGGHHEIQGGHSMQMGTDWVFVQRRCRWCDATDL